MLGTDACEGISINSFSKVRCNNPQAYFDSININLQRNKFEMLKAIVKNQTDILLVSAKLDDSLFQRANSVYTVLQLLIDLAHTFEVLKRYY